MRNKIFNLLVVAVLTLIFVWFFVFSNGYSSLKHQFSSINTYWIATAAACIIVFWFFESLIIYIITKSLYSTDYMFIKSIKIAMIGQFFSAITPFQSGGQPAQLFVMTENDVPAGLSGSILMVKFIIHQGTLTFYSILVIILKFNYFNSKIPYFIDFCFIGFAVNSLIIVFCLIFSINQKFTFKLLYVVLNLLHKVRLLKDVEDKYKRFEKELLSFHESSAIMGKNIQMCLLSSFFTFVQWTLYYAIPYCIYRSFGLNSTDLWTMICAQVFLTMFMSFIPLPGAAGGAEGGFFLIFGIFFKGDTIVPAIFMWRLITYYASILAGGFSSVLLPNSNNKNLDLL